MKAKRMYKAAEHAGFNNEQAQEIGRELERIGTVTPERVVANAADEESPLHTFFEWDDATAAVEYRLEQARHMVRHLLIEVKTPEGVRTTRAYHNVTVTLSEQPAARVYAPIRVIKQDEHFQEQVKAKALSELRGWQERYSEYAYLFGNLLQTIEEVLDQAEQTDHPRRVSA